MQPLFSPANQIRIALTKFSDFGVKIMKLVYSFLIFFVALSVAMICPAQTYPAFDQMSQTKILLEDGEIESRVERLLMKRDVGELANELASRKSAQTISDLLIKLSVFARAGHRERVHETLSEVGNIYLSADNKDQILRVARRAITIDDFTAQKIFYEKIAVGGDDKASAFVSLWRKKGDVRELENWLKVRAETSENWWFLYAALKKDLGTADEIAEDLKRKIKKDPQDFSLVEKYLYIVQNVIYSSVGFFEPSYKQDISWLAETAVTDSANGSYEIGQLLKSLNPSLAERLFKKSLLLPFTETDKISFIKKTYRYTSISPEDDINAEKQMRYWTKLALMEVYRKNGQPQLAQTIAEELTAMDMSGIREGNPYFTAGAVQAASGQRVIETRILQSESENSALPEYWLKRASYYAGRQEKDLVLQTFTQALDKFPYAPNDYKISLPRLKILREISFFGGEGTVSETILRREFLNAKAKNDAKYLYQLLNFISDNYENLMDEFFVNTDLLPKVLSSREVWRDNEEEDVIYNAIHSENWKTEKLQIIWNQLSVLAEKDLKNRAPALASAMRSVGEYKKAVPLLEKLLKILPDKAEDELHDYDRPDAERDLFDSYIGSGDWKSAEKMFFAGFRFRGDELGKIAAVAAKSGNIKDAVRLWKTNANLDRRNLVELYELNKTAAKPLLREFYLDIKKSDPLSDAVDKVLSDYLQP